MTLFGTGIGEAGDGCCCFLVFSGLAATVAPAIVGLLRRSVSAVLFSFLLAGLVGAVVVPEAVNHELRDTDDSRGVHAMLWQFVWWWAVALLIPLAAAVSLFFRGPMPKDESTSSTESDEAARAADDSGPQPAGPTWSPPEPATFHFQIGRLLALCLLLLLLSLLAMLTR